MCKFQAKTIALSRPLLAKAAFAEFRDVVAHEIAHAIVGPRVKTHGLAWQRVAYKLGAAPFA